MTIIILQLIISIVMVLYGAWYYFNDKPKFLGAFFVVVGIVVLLLCGIAMHSRVIDVHKHHRIVVQDTVFVEHTIVIGVDDTVTVRTIDFIGTDEEPKP